jgi:hypothetical protein
MNYFKPVSLLMLIFLFACTDQKVVKNKNLTKKNNLTIDYKYQPREWQTCYGLKDDYYKSMIDKDGGLWYNFAYGNHIGFPYDNYCYERNKGYRLAIFPQLILPEDTSKRHQKMHSAKEPVIINQKGYNNFVYHQTTFASFADKNHPLQSRYDLCAISVENIGEEESNVTLRLEFNTIHQMELDERAKKAYLVKFGEGKELIAEFPVAVDRFAGHISKMKYTYYLDFNLEKISAGDSTEFLFPIYRSEELPESILPLTLTSELEKVSHYWQNLHVPYEYIQLPDSGMQELLTSAIRNVYQAREIKEGIPAFQVGPTFYRGTWAVDGPFFMEAMTYLGQEDDVRAAIEGIFKVGETQGDRGESFAKQAGLRIWMVYRHAQLTGDQQWLEKNWSWIENEVANMKRYRANSYKDGNPLTDGLLPMGNADGGIGGIYAEYTNTYWVLSGLNYAIRAAELLEKEGQAREWQIFYDDFYQVFNKARERDKKMDQYGNPYVPVFMGHNTLNPTTGQWAFMHSVFPGKIYDIDDSLMIGTLAMLDSTLVEGLILGTGWLPKGLWTYSASFQAHALLWNGHGYRVPQMLYDFANHASPLLCWSEEQHPVDYQGDYLAHGDMPHNWASVDFVRLLRHSLVLERGNELHFFEGLPTEWLFPGMITKLEDIATTHGVVSLELNVTESGEKAMLHINIDTSYHTPPARIIIDNAAFNKKSEKTIMDFEEEIKVEIRLSEER